MACRCNTGLYEFSQQMVFDGYGRTDEASFVRKNLQRFAMALPRKAANLSCLLWDFLSAVLS
uniref:Uncharacterized protein n=1 Tax=Oryza rufipogon TaxID=4529 RepID=A0A0E0QNB4_ORYRU